MTSLSDDVKAVVIDMCLQKKILRDPSREYNSDSSELPRYLAEPHGMLCEINIWIQHKIRGHRLLNYFNLPPDFPDMFTSFLTPTGTLRIVEFVRNFYNQIHASTDPITYEEVLLWPLDYVIDVADLFLITATASALSAYMIRIADPNSMGPTTPSQLSTLANCYEIVVSSYRSAYIRTTVGLNVKPLHSHIDVLETMCTETGPKGKTSVSLSPSSSSLETSSCSGSGSGEVKGAWNPYTTLRRLENTSQSELYAYILYVWIQLDIGTSDRLGVEQIKASAFCGSVLEREMLVVLRLNRSAVCCLLMICAQAMYHCGEGSYTENPLKILLRKLGSETAHLEHQSDESTKRLIGDVSKSLAISSPKVPTEWRTATHNLVWVVSAWRMARVYWTNVLGHAISAKLSSDNVRMYTFCNQFIDAFEKGYRDEIIGKRTELLAHNKCADKPFQMSSSDLRVDDAGTTSDDSDDTEDNEARHVSPHTREDIVIGEIGPPIYATIARMEPAPDNTTWARTRNVSMPSSMHTAQQPFVANSTQRPGSHRVTVSRYDRNKPSMSEEIARKVRGENVQMIKH